MTVTLGQPLSPDPALFAELAAGVWDRHRWSNDGPLVRELEQRLGARLDWPHAIATSSGTSALTTALLALNLPSGGEVVTTPLTFRATALAIEAAGLIPRLRRSRRDDPLPATGRRPGGDQPTDRRDSSRAPVRPRRR